MKGNYMQTNVKIISAFPGCGKTYLYNNQQIYGLKIIDAESHYFTKTYNWQKTYIKYIMQRLNDIDFILISQHDEVLQELKDNNLMFVTVAPDNSINLSDRDKKIIKQQWFGRFVLRNNNHVNDFDKWLKKMNLMYDEWTNPNFFKQFNPYKHFCLNQNQYLCDIIEEIRNL